MSADTVWCMIWAAMVGGCLGFFVACIMVSRSIYQAHADGYQECCDDVAKGRIFDGVRWKLAEPENRGKEAAQ